METLKLTKMPPTAPKGLVIKIQPNHVWCDFSGLVNIEEKKDFIKSVADIVNYDFQMPDSVTAHSINDREADIEVANVIFEKKLSDILSGVTEPTYLKYREFTHDVGAQSVVLKSWVNIVGLPFDEIPNYFSSVFFFGLKKQYPSDPMVKFVQIEDEEDAEIKILAFKITHGETGETGYYNISYRDPRKGQGLM